MVVSVSHYPSNGHGLSITVLCSARHLVEGDTPSDSAFDERGNFFLCSRVLGRIDSRIMGSGCHLSRNIDCMHDHQHCNAGSILEMLDVRQRRKE